MSSAHILTKKTNELSLPASLYRARLQSSFNKISYSVLVTKNVFFAWFTPADFGKLSICRSKELFEVLTSSKPWHLTRSRVSSQKLYGLVSSTRTVLEKDHAPGYQPNRQF